jgi:histidinol-phosphate aminotransferase
MSRFVDLVSNPARKIGMAAAFEHSANTRRALIHLDSNENPFGPSPRALEAMRKALSDCNRYPDDDCSQLRNKLSDFHNLPLEHVLVTAGSTQMLALLCQTMLQPGRNAVTSERSFIVYKMLVQAAGADLIEVPMRDERFDLEAILGEINEYTRLVFLANPNNPTGTIVDPDAIAQFIAKLPKHVVLVLDEAYYEFAAYFAEHRKAEYSRSLDYVREGANVVVLRTFSKVHGLAGLRIGYGLGPAELLAYCAKMRNTYSVSSVSSVAQAAAFAAMDDHDHIAHTLMNNAQQAEILAAELTGLGFRVVPTWANFLYCELPGGGSRFCARSSGRRHQRASPSCMGCSKMHSRQHWNTRSECGIPRGSPEDLREKPLGPQTALFERWKSSAPKQPRIAAQQGALDHCSPLLQLRVAAPLGSRSRALPRFFCGILRRGCGIDQRAAPDFFEHARGKSIPSACDPAADHVRRQVEDVDDIRQQDS